MNTPGIDAVLNLTPDATEALYDFQIDENGDIKTEDQLETAILVSLFSDRRADPAQVPKPQLRRGWIGDLESPGDPIGSTLWLLEQRRLTASVALEATDAADVALAWFKDDNIAISVGTRGFIEVDAMRLAIDMTKPNSRSESFAVRLWDRTGRG
jgi:phage gp46-like protein